MLGLFGRKSDHPLADPKSASDLMDSLPRNDGPKALQELTDWVESICEDAAFRLDERFAALRLLDENARPHKRKLTRELYSNSSLSGFQQNRLWTLLNEFATQLSRAYGGVLAGYRNGDKGAAPLRTLQSLIAARAIHAAKGRLKCAAVRYAQADPEVWTLLAASYAQAESGGYLDEPLALYPGYSADSSIRCEFAAALLWWMSGTGTLKPQQSHLAERLIMHWCQYYTVEAQPIAGTLLSFDLQQPGPPARFTGEAMAHPALRFIGLGQVQAQLDSLIKTLDKGIVPDEINFGGSFSVEAVLDVAKRLTGFWASPPPMRRSPRRSIHVNLQVAGGFSRMVEQADSGFDPGIHAVDRWEVEEISAGGFRCILPAGRDDDVRIGLLIGIRPEKVGHWGAGIVRRIGRDAQNRLHAGVEMLSSQVEGAVLREGNHSGMNEEQPALWVRRGDIDAGEAWLLMKLDTFSVNRTLLMRAAGRQYLLIPLALMERGEDYDFARYRLIEQEVSADEETY